MSRQLEFCERVIPLRPTETIVIDAREFERMVCMLRAAPVIAFDTETSGLAWWAHARLCGISFAMRDPARGIVSWYVPIRHNTGAEQLPMELVGPAIKQILEDPRKTKVAHNLKFDEHIVLREGWNVRGPRYDTMIAARLYDENRQATLKSRAEEDLGYPEAREAEMILDREVLKLAKSMKMGVEPYRGQHGYSQVGIGIAGPYACRDAAYTYELFEFYERWGVSRNYARIWNTEMKLTEVLCDMEEVGLPVDRGYLELLRDGVSGEKAAIEDRLLTVLGAKYFKIGSDLELRKYLTEEMRLPLTKLTTKKQLAVDAEVLSQFAAHDRTGVLSLILLWRAAEKIASTYTTSILKKLDARDILHGNFRQVGTTTGRMASSDPNLQNFSSDDNDRALKFSGKSLEDGGSDPWSVRRAFTVSPGRCRLIFDYDQIELKVMAAYSRDPIMVDNYLKGGDIHKRTAEEVGVPRRIAKICNFGTVYGISALGLTRKANVSMEEAEGFMQKFFSTYLGIENFRKKFWQGVRMSGGVFNNIWGRARRVPEINSYRGYERGRAERQAISSLIQGTAAELTKESLVRIFEILRDRKLPAKLTSTVHDEIWVDTDVSCFAEVARLVKREMEDFSEFQPIPIKVSGKYTTTNWAEKKSF